MNESLLHHVSTQLLLSAAWDSGSEGGDDGTIKNLVYVGRKIPSKTFQRLQKVMDRRASVDKQNDPRIDVDVAVDKIDIGTHEPDKYLDLLRKSVEEQMGVEVSWLDKPQTNHNNHGDW